jgi:cold shock CspA family protein
MMALTQSIPDVFMHLSNVHLEHRPNIAVGQAVEFTLVNAPKGIAARDVVVIGGAALS